MLEFSLEQTPPTVEMIEKERAEVLREMQSITKRDTIITFFLIILVSFLIGMIVYSATDNSMYAGIAVAFLPLLGIILSLIGVTQAMGFRSAAIRLNDLKNDLIALNQVSDDNSRDIEHLCKHHRMVYEYQQAVIASKRSPINAELAMYWAFDSSTLAKTAKGRDFLIKARKSVKF
jgi:hypothetical protein